MQIGERGAKPLDGKLLSALFRSPSHRSSQPHVTEQFYDTLRKGVRILWRNQKATLPV